MISISQKSAGSKATTRPRRTHGWGATWGEHGACHIPYAYLGDSNLASDLWTITKVESTAW